jgi:peptidoglycan-associated lipoprotein
MATTNKFLNASSLVVLGFLAACASDEAANVAAEPPPAAVTSASPATLNNGQIIPGSLQDFQQNVGDRVFFAYDRYDLDEQGRSILRRQAEWLAKYPTVTLTVEGHADERGTREYNLALGARRATTVREYLTSLGMSPSRLETMSYGKERPACLESSESCWSQNRRGQSTIRSGAAS